MKPIITIKNTSKFPDRFIKVFVKWLIKKNNIDWNISFIFRNSKEDKKYSGRAWEKEIHIDFKRKFEGPYKHKDWRYKWSKEYIFNSVIELFVFICGHELKHSINRHNFQRSHKRSNNEFFCDEHGYKMVQEFRKDWLLIRSKIRKRRKHHD